MNDEDYALFALIVVFSVLHLIGEIIIYAGKEGGLLIRYVTKPFIMPLMAAYYIFAAPRVCTFILLGIFIAYVGDILLMVSSPEKRRFAYFIGLIAYPISHLSYIAAFISNYVRFAETFVFRYWTIALIIPILALGVFASIKILPKAEKMKIPMLINIIILVVMSISATLFFNTTEFVARGTISLVVGVFVYMFSVLVFAWHNYVQKIPFERIIKMSTYLIGIFLVIQGFMWAIIFDCGCF